MSAVPKGSLILVSGANGFISSHVCDQLLAFGYKVRGTVRTEQKGKWLTELFDKAHGKGAFTYAIVPDMSAPDAFGDAIKGVQGVAHVASPVNFDPKSNQIEVAVNGVKNMMSSAAKEKGVARFVLTSSSAAATMPKSNTKLHLDANSWNEEAVKGSKEPPFEGPVKGFQVYAAGKTLAEQEAWAFMKQNKPGFVLNTVLPNFTMGRILHDEQHGSTAGMVKGMWEGNEEAISTLREVIAPQNYVHVKDIAALHVAGIALDDVQNQRLYGFGGPFNFNSFVDAMKKIEPSHTLPPKVDGMGEDISTIDKASAIHALQTLRGNSFMSFEEGVRDCIAAKAYP